MRADKRVGFVFWAVILGHVTIYVILFNTRELPSQSLLAYNEPWEPEYRSFGEACQVAAAALGSFALFFCISCADRVVPSWRAELSAAIGCASFIFQCGCIAAFFHFREDLLHVCAAGVTVGWIARHVHSRFSAALVAITFCIYIAFWSMARPSFAFRPFWDVFRESAVCLGISALFFFISWSELGSTLTGFWALYFLSSLVTLGIFAAYLAGVASLSFGFSPFIGIFTRSLFFPGRFREGLEEMAEHNTLNKTITFEGTVSHEPICCLKGFTHVRRSIRASCRRIEPCRCNYSVISGPRRTQSRFECKLRAP